MGQERRQPVALLKLCFVEMWERFGFVTLLAIAALYFASPVIDGGLGWSNADAVLWVGYFGALLMSLPILGGWAADRFLGAKRAVLIGGVMMAAGYLLLGCLPGVYALTEFDLATLNAIFHDAGLTLARLEPQPASWQRVAAALATRIGGDDAASTALQSVALAYRMQTLLLALAFMLVALGNALFKPNVSAIVGSLYSPGDTRRDSGFTLFWTFINAGLLLAYLVGGGVGERLGWHFGFLAAFLGMTIGIAYYLYIRGQLPDPPRSGPSRDAVGRPEKLTGQERRRIGAILIMIAFAVVFHACHLQMFGLIGLFILQDVDRDLGGFEVPALWIGSLNPLVILAFAPAAAMLWDYLGRRGRNPSFAIKFVMALTLLALGQVILFIAASEAEGPQQGALLPVVLAIVVMSLAEFPLQPIGLSMVTQLAPAKFVGLMLGAWLLGMAIASGIGGNIGALASTHGLPPVFAGMAVACVGAAGGLTLLRGFIARWMALADTRSAPNSQAHAISPAPVPGEPRNAR